MINIQREHQIPESLETPEIKKYIIDIQAHLTDPINVIKPTPPDTYRNSDLLAAFDRCFYSKCYLTEQWFPNSWCMDIEHFIPQAENPQKRYDWGNLYPADHRANNMKPRITPPGGYLDPCDPADDVETEIMYSLSSMGQIPKFEPRDHANIKATNTSNLLNNIHNGHDNNTKLSTAGLRFEIQKKYDHILNLLINWLDSPHGTDIRHQYGIEIKMHLSRRSSFTMLIRSMVAVINHVPPNFKD
jgi:hypothetical protein